MTGLVELRGAVRSPAGPVRSADPAPPGVDVMQAAGRRSFRLPYLGIWGPLLTSVVVLVLDLVEGPSIQYVGLLVAMPFFASALAGPAATAGVGIAVLALGFGFGFLQGLDADPASAGLSMPQLVRLAFILVAVGGAVVVAAIRVRRERRLAGLARVAFAAQMAIMRPVSPRVGQVRCAVRYSSATQEAQIGGDLIEVLDTAFGVRAIIGDVRGKGLDAVRMAGQVLGSFREQAFVCAELGEVAFALDASVRRLAGPEDFVTALLLQVRPDGFISLLSCGHPAPLLVPAGTDHPDGDQGPVDGVRALCTEPHHAPLGLLTELPAPRGEYLTPGDRIVAVTDGILEARRDGRFFDTPAALRQALAGRELEAGLDVLFDLLSGFVHGLLQDDVAVLGFEFLGPRREQFGVVGQRSRRH